MPLIPAFGRQRQVISVCEFKASLVYKVSSRTARTVTQRNPVLKNKQTKYKQTKNKQTKSMWQNDNKQKVH